MKTKPRRKSVKTRRKTAASTTRKRKRPLAKRVRAKVARVRRKRKSPSKSTPVSRWIWGMITAPLGLAVLFWMTHQSGGPVPYQTLDVNYTGTRETASVNKTPTAVQPGPLTQEFSKVSQLDLGDRIAFWSESLYQSEKEISGKLSQIPGAPSIADTAPLVPEHFNCTTFVETVAALAKSKIDGDFYKNLLSIRYKNSSATFYERNHFPEADWIPHNQTAGILRDITQVTAGVSGAQIYSESKMIKRGEWLNHQLRAGKISRTVASVDNQEWNQPVHVDLPYLAVEDAEKFAGKIPNGSVLNLVRKNNDKKPVLITHQGFVLQKGNKTLLRHASPSGHIRTVELVDYLRNLKMRDSKSWPLIGVNLNQFSGS